MGRLFFADFAGSEGVYGFGPQEIAAALRHLKRPYSVDQEGGRNQRLIADQLEHLFDMSRGEFPTNQSVILGSKFETFGCLQAIFWRPIFTAVEDMETGKLRSEIRKGVDPSTELKTLVLPAYITPSDSDDLAKGELILIAFHVRAHKNMNADWERNEYAVNKDLANYLDRRGFRLHLLDQHNFSMFTNGNSVENMLGLFKGEINPHSLMVRCKEVGVRLVQYFGAEVGTEKPITTNIGSRVASVTYCKGHLLLDLCETLAPDLQVHGEPPLPAIRVIEERALFHQPKRDRLDDGWNLSRGGILVR